MERICEYYENIGLPKMLIPKKLKDFGNHLDIKAEFEYWLENQEYMKDGVAVDGYTAKELAKEFYFEKIRGDAIYLDGKSLF